MLKLCNTFQENKGFVSSLKRDVYRKKYASTLITYILVLILTNRNSVPVVCW